MIRFISISPTARRARNTCLGTLLLIALLLIVLAFSSCRTTATVVSLPHNDSIVIRDRLVRDSIFVRDSVFVHLKNDTLYIDRWHTRWCYRLVATTDTLYRDREVHVTLPPERYVPTVYRIALYLCIAFALLIIARICARLYLR